MSTSVTSVVQEVAPPTAEIDASLVPVAVLAHTDAFTSTVDLLVGPASALLFEQIGATLALIEPPIVSVDLASLPWEYDSIAQIEFGVNALHALVHGHLPLTLI